MCTANYTVECYRSIKVQHQGSFWYLMNVSPKFAKLAFLTLTWYICNLVVTEYFSIVFTVGSLWVKIPTVQIAYFKHWRSFELHIKWKHVVCRSQHCLPLPIKPNRSLPKISRTFIDLPTLSGCWRCSLKLDAVDKYHKYWGHLVIRLSKKCNTYRDWVYGTWQDKALNINKLFESKTIWEDM